MSKVDEFDEKCCVCDGPASVDVYCGICPEIADRSGYLCGDCGVGTPEKQACYEHACGICSDASIETSCLECERGVWYYCSVNGPLPNHKTIVDDVCRYCFDCECTEKWLKCGDDPRLQDWKCPACEYCIWEDVTPLRSFSCFQDPGQRHIDDMFAVTEQKHE